MLVTVSLLVILITFIVSWLWSRRNRQQVFINQGIPGPKPGVLLGNFSYLRDDKVLENFLRTAKKTYGKRFSFCFGKYPAMFTSDLDDIQNVLIKNFDNFRNRGGLIAVNNVTVRSVVALRDNDWKRVRSILSPSFTSAKLKSFMSRIMQKRTTYLIEEIHKQIENERPIDFFSLFQRLTMDVIAESVFDTDINSVQRYSEAKPFLNAIGSIIPNQFDKANAALMAFLPACLRTYLKSKEGKEMDDDQEKIQQYCKKIIKERRNSTTKKQDALQLMIDGRTDKYKSLSEVEVLDNVTTFLLAGYETTSTALSFTSLLLACHPEVQENLYREIQENVPNTNEVTFDDVKHLQYLDQVWHESLRLYPPGAAMLGREAANSTTLGDIDVPAGTWIMISPLMVHYDPEHWPEPERFLPERWAPENRQSIHPCSFLAFGEGPRHCIGKRFGEIEAKIALMKLVNAFELKPAKEEHTHPMPLGKLIPTIAPAGGSILLCATPRKK